ncbi:MAG: metalloregulator ArsR/SmtB family transcription factor [Candidatus Andersenbacteria bacterium]|nr:metalloregulator ArsR/SmtB family transcription factor [Candidatus Andersenbacteria bacterium]
MSELCDQIETFGKGIGNATRYKIVEALADGPKSVTELAKIVEVSQPVMSQHLKTLKSSNLVTDQRRGQEVIYTVNSKYLLELIKNLTHAVKKPKS